MTALSLASTAPAPRLRLPALCLPSVRPALPAERLQTRLVVHGVLAPGAISRRLDRTTIDAVCRFQRGRGLRVDGIPGPVTCDALLAAAGVGADPRAPLTPADGSGRRPEPARDQRGALTAA